MHCGKNLYTYDTFAKWHKPHIASYVDKNQMLFNLNKLCTSSTEFPYAQRNHFQSDVVVC